MNSTARTARSARAAAAAVALAAVAILSVPGTSDAATDAVPTTGCDEILLGTPDVAAALRYSLRSDRSDPQVLEGATFGSRDKVYVFLQIPVLDGADTEGYKVEFWVDNCSVLPSVARDYRVNPAVDNGGWDIGGGNTTRTTAFSLNRETNVWHTMITRRTKEFDTTATPVVSSSTFCIKAKPSDCL
jgi:hypothetical protein